MLPLPTRARTRRESERWLPSWRSIAVTLAIVALVLGGYAVARWTPVFAIRSVEIEGASSDVERRVRAALRPLRTTNLVEFDAERARQLVTAVPYVASVRFDRAFPDTLRVFVTPERPVAVLRRGRDAWIASARARVLATLKEGDPPALPRVWLPPTSEPIVGAVLSDTAAAAVRALGPMSRVRLPVAIRSARMDNGELTVVLTSGVVVLLGDPYELRLKLSVVARVLPLAGDAKAIDASVPDRVVAGHRVVINPQVEDEA